MTATTIDRAPELLGVRPLLRFMRRRDRWYGALWATGIVGLAAISAASVIELYDDEDALALYAELARAESAMKAFAGPGHGLDSPSTGAVVMNELLIMSFLTVALMSIFTIVRHTRAEEDSSRSELVRSAAIGRHSILAAAVLWCAGLNATVAGAMAVVLLALGLEVTGTLAFVVALFGVGLLAGGAGAVASQVASTARGARAGAGLALGVAFVLRAIGDVGVPVIVWCSPLGWAQSIRAFADERWWVLLLVFGVSGLLFWSAGSLAGRRDFGSGMLPQKAGPATAAAWLSSPVTLALRLQRGSIAAWSLSMGALGFLYGLLADQADAFLEDATIAEMFELAGVGSATDAYLSTTMLIMGLMVAGFVASSVLRVRSEEHAQRLDIVLAGPVSRRRWLSSQLVVAALGTAVVMTACGLGSGVGYALQVSDGQAIATMLGAALHLLPGLAIVGAVAVLLCGAFRRATWAAWVFVAAVAVIEMLGETLDLPSWSRDLSPFQHLGRRPGTEVDWLAMVLLLVVAAVIAAMGIQAFVRRDLD